MKAPGIISQARMTSTRLPGKVLIPVNGIPVLKYHTERLRQSGLPVFLATTVNATDDVIAEFGIMEKILVHRGSENNVLSRYYEAAGEFGLDVIVRVTSDCPLIDGSVIKQAVDEYLSLNDPYMYLSNVTTRTFPRGFDFEVFSFEALKEAYEHAITPAQKEHVTPYIRENVAGNITTRDITLTLDHSDLRITLDTPEDLQLISILIEKYKAHTLDHQEIIRILREHPELAKINAHVEQKKA